VLLIISFFTMTKFTEGPTLVEVFEKKVLRRIFGAR
jgi:hypothetical protein